jgi:type IV pilus assembly protein PilM
VGIAGPNVIVKQITLPLMDEDEVGQALRFESRKHLPFDPQGMVIDFQILGRSMTEKRMDVLLAAVPEERLEKRIAPLRLLGIEADIVDATPLALANAVFHQAPPRAEPQIILDIGYDSSHLVLHQRSEPFFTRRLEFGGRTITESIARGMKIPFEEAEEWKVSTSEVPGREADWTLPEMKFILDALRFDLIEELRRSIAFYRTIGRLPETFSLWISGGSARLPGLDQRLHELLECPVIVFNPATSMGAGKGGDRVPLPPQFTQALGLALRNG